MQPFRDLPEPFRDKLKACLAALKKKKNRLISRFCFKSSSSVDTLFFQKKKTQKLDLNNCFGRRV